MKNLLLFTAVLSIFTLFSCESTENNNEQIYGKWQAISWEVDGVENLGEGANVTFVFNEDETYTASSGSSEEAGSYRLTENNLYTTAKGQIQKLVQINLPSTDTMMMNMNRAGTPEMMTLVRNQ